MFGKIRNKAKFAILILFLIFSLCGCSNVCQAQETTKEIQVLGVGIIHGGKIVGAKDQAISNSLASAVARALEELVPSSVISANFQKLDQFFFDEAGEYISNYRVLTENRTETTYRIYVQASVYSEKIKSRLSELGIVLSENDLPKALFLIAEQKIENLLPVYWWGEEPSFALAVAESALALIFEEKGFTVIDHGGMLVHDETAGGLENGAGLSSDFSGAQDFPTDLSAGRKVESVDYNNPYLSNQEAAQIGYRLNADIVIVGTAKANIVPNTMGATIRSFKGVVNLRVVDVVRGDEIATINREAVTVNADEAAGGKDALKTAGELAGRDLSSQIVLSWKKSFGPAGAVQVVIKGTSDLGSYVSLRRTLQEIPGVNSLQIQEMKLDEAVLSVDYDGGSKALAESLMRKTFDNFGVNIFEMSDDRLRLEIISNRRGPGALQTAPRP